MTPTKLTLPTEKGDVEVNSFYRWTAQISGQPIDFALVESPMHPTGHGQQLTVVVEKFGYSTGITLDHPSHKGRQMTAEVFNPGSKFKVKRAKVENMARSRVSSLLKRVGEDVFMDAYTIAALQAQLHAKRKDNPPVEEESHADDSQ